MDVFAWFLVISLAGDEEGVLLKQASSKKECLQFKQEFLKKFKKKMDNFSSIECEEGTVLQTQKANEEEYL